MASYRKSFSKVLAEKRAFFALVESIAWQIAKDGGEDEITPEIRERAREIAKAQTAPKY